ncbi:hypothetical protein PFISCL1PPCAC_22114, partial [Pristionchus fissidentatus]
VYCPFHGKQANVHTSAPASLTCSTLCTTKIVTFAARSIARRATIPRTRAVKSHELGKGPKFTWTKQGSIKKIWKQRVTGCCIIID